MNKKTFIDNIYYFANSIIGHFDSLTDNDFSDKIIKENGINSCKNSYFFYSLCIKMDESYNNIDSIDFVILLTEKIKNEIAENLKSDSENRILLICDLNNLLSVIKQYKNYFENNEQQEMENE